MLCDVMFFVGGEIFFVYWNVLVVSCFYFYKLFISDMREKMFESINFEVLEVFVDVVDILLIYFYIGIIDVM